MKTFYGHIVFCEDLDSGDTFYIEVFLNAANADDIELRAEKKARRNELVELSGNGFEFTYEFPSGTVWQFDELGNKIKAHAIYQNAAELLQQFTY